VIGSSKTMEPNLLITRPTVYFSLLQDK
jgi:hypothetical protein